MNWEAKTLDDIKLVAGSIIEQLSPGIVLVDGKMGAGKTTLVSEICRQLGVEGKTSSPTYSIVNEYYSPTQGVIYHFDCYRMESEEEAYDIGMEDYLDSGNFCFIEWSEKIENLLPATCVRISIQVKQETRIISLIQ